QSQFWPTDLLLQGLLGRNKAISPASAKPQAFKGAGWALPLLSLGLRGGIQLLSSPPWLTRTSSMRVAPRALLSATTLSLSLCLSSNTLLPSESLAVNFVTSLPSRPRLNASTLSIGSGVSNFPATTRTLCSPGKPMFTEAELASPSLISFAPG